MLYSTTVFVDRGDEDIMLETAICKIFCSEMGFRCTDMALQIMGGEGYMTENEVERLWRDSRINTIVEGANEVMHSFVFAYGSKQLGEYLLSVKNNPTSHILEGMRIALELFAGWKKPRPNITRLRPELAHFQDQLEKLIQEFSYQVKQMFVKHKEQLVTLQMIQYRLSWSVMWIHAMTCSLAKLDKALRDGVNGQQMEQDMRIVEHICAIAEDEINASFRALRQNTDRTMVRCAEAAMKQMDLAPNSDYVIPEKTPDNSAAGTGRIPDQTHIPQFGSDSTVQTSDVPHL